MTNQLNLTESKPTYQSEWTCPIGQADKMFAAIKAAGLRPVTWGYKPASKKTGKPAHNWASCIPDRTAAQVWNQPKMR